MCVFPYSLQIGGTNTIIVVLSVSLNLTEIQCICKLDFRKVL